MPERAAAPLGARREARERAVALLYEAEAKGVDPADLLETLPVPETGYAGVLVRGVADDQPALDEVLGRLSRNWTVARMPAVDRAVLRLGLYELAHEPDVPTKVVIDEAIELAKRFSTEESGRFVNGVLARAADELRPDSLADGRRANPDA